MRQAKDALATEVEDMEQDGEVLPPPVAGSGDLFGFVNGQAGGVMDIVGFSVVSDLLQLQG